MMKKFLAGLLALSLVTGSVSAVNAQCFCPSDATMDLSYSDLRCLESSHIWAENWMEIYDNIGFNLK